MNRLVFNPRPDITAYELAQIFRAISFHQPLLPDPATLASIPPEVRRHLDNYSQVERVGAHSFVDEDPNCEHCGQALGEVKAGRAEACIKYIDRTAYPLGTMHLAGAPRGYDNSTAEPAPACPNCGNADHGDMVPETELEGGELRLTGMTECLKCHEKFPTPPAPQVAP